MAEKQCNLVKNSGGVQYTTAEKIVGTWIDGKTIYEQTFTGTTPADASTPLDISIPNLLTVCRLEGFTTPTSGVRMCLQYEDASNFFKGYGTTNKIQIWCSGNAVLSKPYAVTAWYTKS